MASARTKLPRKRNTTGSPKGANISIAVPTPRSTERAAPSKAVTGIGTASVIHQVKTSANTATRRAAGADNPEIGKTRRPTNRTGPDRRPAAFRIRSNRSSAGERAAVSSARSSPGVSSARSVSSAGVPAVDSRR
jgi:hypothetical protein